MNRRKRSYYASPHYPMVPLGELATFIQYGISERANTAGVGVPMIRMSNLQVNGWDLCDLKHIELEDVDLDRYRLSKGDLLFNRTNSKELVGKCEVFGEEGDWVFASYLIRVRLDTQRALPGFVSAFLNSPAGRIQIDQVSRQVAGMSNVNTGELRDLLIPLPDIAVQRRLLAELETARIERDQSLRSSADLLTSLDRYVLDALGIFPKEDDPRPFAVRFSDVRQRLDADYNSPRFQKLRRAIESSKYTTRTLNELTLFMRSGFAAGRQDQAHGEDQGVPHLRPLNLNAWGELSISETKRVPASAVSAGDYIQHGEVLFNNTNSAEWVGKSAVFDLEEACACSNHMTRIFLQSGNDSYFIAALLNAFRGIGYFSALSTFFNNQAGINTSTLGLLRVPVPDIEVQQAIASATRDRKREAARLRAHAEALWKEARERFARELLKVDLS
ncbi:MAG: restriction endonuclease subunit S [Hyphomicrobiales bacterium]|nr:MAG: restriction endonuclease subunit S [Hyphomicrobiales bacterium]